MEGGDGQAAETDPGLEAPEVLSADEVWKSVAKLTRPDFGRLRRAARYFAWRSDMDADDLLQEAFTRALRGSRQCGRKTDFIAFLCGTMRSIAYEVNRARKHDPKLVAIAESRSDLEPATYAPSPEREVISRIDYGEVLRRIDAAVADDEELQYLLEGVKDGMRGEDLQDLLGVDEKGLATARRRLKRRIEKAVGKEVAI